VIEFPEILEIDLNPMIVDESGRAFAVDARIVMDRDRVMREVAEHRDCLVIAPYPKKYVATRHLKDGTAVLLRPMKPEDEARFNELFNSLSAETKRFRFFEMIKELSHEALTRYCNIDYDREIAIVAELPAAEKRIMGVVGLAVEASRRSGEFAVLVGDQWQRLGLGSKLMDFIADVARDMHLAEIHGYVIPSNYKMLDMCRKKGFGVETLDEDTVKVTLKLPR
jgi:acetyltransferase